MVGMESKMEDEKGLGKQHFEAFREALWSENIESQEISEKVPREIDKPTVQLTARWWRVKAISRPTRAV